MSIPMMAEREEALKLWEAKNAAEDAYDKALLAASEAKPDVVSKYDALEVELGALEYDDQDAWDAALIALHAKRDAELGLADLSAAFKAANEACDSEPICIWNGGEYVPARCAKTNIVLFWSDETVSDDETGEMWLRSALGLPPRPAKVEDEEIEEAA